MAYQDAQERIYDFGNNIQEGYQNMRTNIQEGMDEFSNRAYVGAESTSNFLDNNTIIAKASFLFLVLIAFMVVFNLAINFSTWLVSSSKSPYLFFGVNGGSMPRIIQQDPAQSDAVVIYRSNNEKTGIEFTWSVWLYISAVATSNYAHIFNKGNAVFANGIATINNGPGLYLDTTNALHFVMNVENDAAGLNTDAIIDISNIPLNKWFHTALRLQNKVMDVYINGIITQRETFLQIPKQNYDNVNLCQNGGFPGSLSNLRYYSYALSSTELAMIVYNGPNLSTPSSSNSATASSDYSYLSSRWYLF